MFWGEGEGGNPYEKRWQSSGKRFGGAEARAQAIGNLITDPSMDNALNLYKPQLDKMKDRWKALELFFGA